MIYNQNTMIQDKDLSHFLANAPKEFKENDRIKKFQLKNGEFIHCVLWKMHFYVSGTDIVKILIWRFQNAGRPCHNNIKKFEEGIFSDLRNLKPGIDATLEPPRSEFLEFLYKNGCIRTQKKQKVFFWYSVPHDALFCDALERDLRRETNIYTYSKYLSNNIPKHMYDQPMSPEEAEYYRKASVDPHYMYSNKIFPSCDNLYAKDYVPDTEFREDSDYRNYHEDGHKPSLFGIHPPSEYTLGEDTLFMDSKNLEDKKDVFADSGLNVSMFNAKDIRNSNFNSDFSKYRNIDQFASHPNTGAYGYMDKPEYGLDKVDYAFAEQDGKYQDHAYFDKINPTQRIPNQSRGKPQQ